MIQERERREKEKRKGIGKTYIPKRVARIVKEVTKAISCSLVLIVCRKGKKEKKILRSCHEWLILKEYMTIGKGEYYTKRANAPLYFGFP